MPKIALTTQSLRQLECPAGLSKQDWHDSECKGLMLEVRASGGKTWYLRYRNARGRQRQLRIADARDLSLSMARRQADQLRAQVALGQDPADIAQASAQVPVLADFVEKQYLPYVRGYKRSWQTDLSLLRNHLLPRLGTQTLDAITREDVVRMHHAQLAAGYAPGSANRLVILLRYIYNLALRWEVRGLSRNPVKDVPMFEENNHRERYLSAAEFERLRLALERSVNPMLRWIVPMLVLTGARKREVLDARWCDFDNERKTWRIPMSKSGKARHVPLSEAVLQLLAQMPRRDDVPWVFANERTGKPFSNIFHSWNTARCQAGLADVRMHDLRHSFASFLINGGRTLYEVQQILGHSQSRTTQRYAHLSHETLLAAVNTASKALQGESTRFY